MRHKNTQSDLLQSKFIELLPRARNGEYTEDDWRLLMTRAVSLENIKDFECATRLYCDNKAVEKHNAEELRKLHNPILVVNAINSRPQIKNSSSEIFSCIPNTIYLCVNAKVNLTTNININIGNYYLLNLSFI
jgi:hypothetical protein